MTLCIDIVTPRLRSQADQLGLTIAIQSPRHLKVVGPDGCADIQSGVVDDKIRLFQEHVCLGEYTPEGAMEAAFTVVSNRYNQQVYQERLAVAQAGEPD